MKILTTFKQMESSEALENYANKRFKEKMTRFIGNLTSAQVVFSVEGAEHHLSCTVKGAGGLHAQVDAKANDMYATVDIAAEKLEAQLRKSKEKLKSRKGNASIREISEIEAKNIIPLEAVDAEDIVKYESAKKRARG